MSSNSYISAGCACVIFIVSSLMVFGPTAVQYLAAVFGIAGALILAVPGVNPAVGFAAFLLSNIGWLGFSASRRHWGLFAQQVAFLITSLVGLWNWWLGPLVLGGTP